LKVDYFEISMPTLIIFCLPPPPTPVVPTGRNQRFTNCRCSLSLDIRDNVHQIVCNYWVGCIVLLGKELCLRCILSIFFFFLSEFRRNYQSSEKNMAGADSGNGRCLEQTPTWAVAVVCHLWPSLYFLNMVFIMLAM